MNNLFVCHSQAHLILAAGLARGRFAREENDLIVFADFEMTDQLKKALINIFFRVLFRPGIYPVVNKKWKAKLSRYPDDIRSIKKFISRRYDRVFVVIDGNIPELFIMKSAVSFNRNVELIWLEDGSFPYYLNTVDIDGLNSNFITRKAREILLKYVLRLGEIYNFEGNHLGGNRNIKKIYITLKGYERSIYKTKEVENITNDEYKNGLSMLFNSKDISLEDGSIILVLDKFNVYKNLEIVRDFINKIYKFSFKKNKTIYYKLHPREEGDLSELEYCVSLNKNLGIEYYYSASTNKKLTIIGIKSTGLQSSKLLGFTTVSAAKILGEGDEELLSFYRSIGIIVPDNIESLFDIL